jgi:hypothetical protein
MALQIAIGDCTLDPGFARGCADDQSAAKGESQQGDVGQLEKMRRLRA